MPNLQAHPSCFSIRMAGLHLLCTTSYILSNKQQLASVSPRPGTSSSQPRFTAWLCLGISKPSISTGHLLLLYSSGRVAPGRTQVGADLAASSGKPQGQHTQWTATDHIGAPSLCPCTADPPRRAGVGGQWSQPVPAESMGTRINTRFISITALTK